MLELAITEGMLFVVAILLLCVDINGVAHIVFSLCVHARHVRMMHVCVHAQCVRAHACSTTDYAQRLLDT